MDVFNSMSVASDSTFGESLAKDQREDSIRGRKVLMVNLEVLALYRELLRKSRLLPKSSWTYYGKYLRENFNAHSEEDDPVRIKAMITKAREDAKWVLEKYS